MKDELDSLRKELDASKTQREASKLIAISAKKRFKFSIIIILILITSALIILDLYVIKSEFIAKFSVVINLVISIATLLKLLIGGLKKWKKILKFAY